VSWTPWKRSLLRGDVHWLQRGGCNCAQSIDGNLLDQQYALLTAAEAFARRWCQVVLRANAQSQRAVNSLRCPQHRPTTLRIAQVEASSDGGKMGLSV
jgi:hypothetical protein